MVGGRWSVDRGCVVVLLLLGGAGGHGGGIHCSYFGLGCLANVGCVVELVLDILFAFCLYILACVVLLGCWLYLLYILLFIIHFL